MDLNDQSDSGSANGDGEGVWSPDIEQCFREAMIMFPPCGRRKHILQEEGGGKMYGRNELIARHIKMRTGKSRTRKQVSSHIQVLARRKAKAEAASAASGLTPSPSGIRQSTHSAGSARSDSDQSAVQQACAYQDVWMDRPIVTQKIRLVEFSAFIEHRNFPSSPGVPTANLGLGANGPPSAQQIQPQQPQQLITLASGLSPALGDHQDISLKVENAQAGTGQQLQPFLVPGPGPAQHTTHPLASNHHLPAQFNQATSYQANSNNNNANNNLNQLQPHPLHQQKSHSLQGNQFIINSHIHPHLQPQPQSSAGFTRHSYIQIDYRRILERQTNKLERIDISQIQDKFLELGGSEGLFQRGPPDAFFLVKFWADLNNDFEYNIDDQNSYFGFSSHFETAEPYKDITCSTKACSYGLQVVEKVEKIFGAFNSSNGRYSYDINRSPMCEFMIQFIKKLRQLPRTTQMNSVLENFTVLQVIRSESTSEILLCLAYVFEVASEQNNGPQYHVYKLTKD